MNAHGDAFEAGHCVGSRASAKGLGSTIDQRFDVVGCEWHGRSLGGKAGETGRTSAVVRCCCSKRIYSRSIGIAGKREKRAKLGDVVVWLCWVEGGALCRVACWSLVAGKVTTETGVVSVRVGWDGYRWSIAWLLLGYMLDNGMGRP